MSQPMTYWWGAAALLLTKVYRPQNYTFHSVVFCDYVQLLLILPQLVSATEQQCHKRIRNTNLRIKKKASGSMQMPHITRRCVIHLCTLIGERERAVQLAQIFYIYFKADYVALYM